MREILDCGLGLSAAIAKHEKFHDLECSALVPLSFQNENSVA